MLCHGSSAQAEQRSSPSHSAVSIKITLATLGAQLPLQCPSPSQDDRSTDFQWIFILFFPSYFGLIIISYPYPAPIIPASVAARPRHFSAARSTAARSTAARRQERSAESGAMSWPRNRILTNQRRAPRPRDQLSTNQGPAWAGSWSLFSLFPRAELRLVTSLRLTATLRGTEEHNTISTPEHPHTYNSN